jgi:tetratricopeptide (TPR) repeat protein
MPDKAVATSPRIKELTRRLEAEPRSRVFVDLAKTLLAEGEGGEAARICREGLQRQPGYHSARVLLGKILVSLDDFAGACTELQKVVQEAPDNILARRLLGEAQEGAGRGGEALESYRALLALNPDDPEVEGRIAALSVAAAPPIPQAAGLETLDLHPDTRAEPLIGEDPDLTSGLPELDMEIPPTATIESSPFAEEADAPARRPAEEPVAPGGAGGGEAGAASAPPSGAFGLDPGPTISMESPEPHPDEVRGMDGADSASGGGDVPRTVALDPGDIARLTGEDLERGAASRHPPSWSGSPEGPEAPESEARTVVIPAPVFEEPPAMRATAPEPPGVDGDPLPDGSGRDEDDEEEAADSALPTPTLAELYLEQGMPGKALSIYEKILEGDPGNSEIRRRLMGLRGGQAASESPSGRKIRALQGWLELLKRNHDAQSRP